MPFAPKHYEGAISALVLHQANFGDSAGAEAGAALLADGSFPKVQAYCLIAEARKKAGDPAGALAAIETAESHAMRIASPRDRAIALSVAAETRMAAGDVPGAIKQADRIDDAAVRSLTLLRAATFQARSGDFDGARAAADRIALEDVRASAYGEIAVARAEAGDWAEAKALTNRIVQPDIFILVQARIARAMLLAGRRDAALRLLGETVDFCRREIKDPGQRCQAFLAPVVLWGKLQ